MKINSISLNYVNRTNQNFAKNIEKKQEKPSTKGINGQSLVMIGKADQYFKLVNNLSNDKIGSKFIIEPKDPKYKELKILITPEASILNKDMYIGVANDINHGVSFKGKLYGSIRNDERGVDNKMMSEYADFWKKGMHYTVTNNFANNIDLKDDYNFYIPSDGDGTRYKDITTLQGGVTKPASRIPATMNNQPMSLVQGVITNFARTGKLTEGFEVIKVKPAQGSAFAFLEGLKNGTISTKKPIIFCWGDNFSDMNVSKLIKEHEDNNSGFTITVIKADKERAKDLGVIKRFEDRQEAIEKFVEKPQDADFINSAVVPEYGENTVLASVGPYVLSPEALSWIKEGYTNNPESFFEPGKGFDFSSRIISPMLDAFNNGEIISEKTGEPLKMTYRVKSDSETWSDLGKQVDLSASMKEIKSGSKYTNLPAEMIESMKKNIDENNNITFDRHTREKFNQFLKENKFIAQNVIVSCNE